jgi:hypothetical protein
MARGRGQKSDQGGCGLLLLMGIVVLAIGRCGGSADPGAVSNLTTSPSALSNETYRYVDVDRLNCRSEPRRNARRITSLERGAFVTVEETEADWSRLDASGSACWVQTRRLTTTAPAASPAPVYASEPTTRGAGRRNSESSSRGGGGREPRQPLRESSSSRCGSKRVCGQMDSCEEANFYLNQCGLGRLDRDNDGVPCESICG